MIKDDFNVEGPPSSKVWSIFGNPRCVGGNLVLSSSADFVRSVAPLTFDKGATLNLKVYSYTFGELQLSPYSISQPPSNLNLPVYIFRFDGYVMRVFKGEQSVGHYFYCYAPLTVRIESAGDTFSVYVKARDATGREQPEVLVTSTANDFKDKDLYIYLVGGPIAFDEIYGIAGKESLGFQLFVLLSGVMVMIPLLILIPLFRTLRKAIKGEES